MEAMSKGLQGVAELPKVVGGNAADDIGGGLLEMLLGVCVCCTRTLRRWASTDG